MKIVGFIKGKSKNRSFNDYKKNDASEYNYKETIDDYTNGEVIDVEYEEIGDKKN